MMAASTLRRVGVGVDTVAIADDCAGRTCATSCCALRSIEANIPALSAVRAVVAKIRTSWRTVRSDAYLPYACGSTVADAPVEEVAGVVSRHLSRVHRESRRVVGLRAVDDRGVVDAERRVALHSGIFDSQRSIVVDRGVLVAKRRVGPAARVRHTRCVGTRASIRAPVEGPTRFPAERHLGETRVALGVGCGARPAASLDTGIRGRMPWLRDTAREEPHKHGESECARSTGGTRLTETRVSGS